MAKTNPKQQGTSITHRTRSQISVYALFTFGVGLMCLVLFFSQKGRHGFGDFVIDKYHTIDLSYDEFNNLDDSSKSNLKDKYLKIFENRKEHYDKSSDDLSTIINALGVCCLISLLVLYYEEKDSISVIGIDVPYKSVFLILPVLMLYLWLSFGFTYFSALDSRQVCYVAAVKYESISDNLDSTKMCVSRDFRMIHNLEDRGIIDGSVHYYNGLYSDKVYAYFYHHRDLNASTAKC